MSRNSRPPVKAASDVEVRVLLDCYQCPVPFHAVRTRNTALIARPNAVLLSIVSPLFDPRCPIAAVDGTIKLAGVFARDPVTNYP